MALWVTLGPALCLALCVALSLALSACAPSTTGSQQAEDPDTLTVFGAASTRVVNEDLQKEWDHPLTIVNGGSSGLLQQLADGAQADVLITADKTTMDAAVQQGLVRDPVAVATNTMVMVVPKGNPAGITDVDEALSSHRLVLCAPQVPCGRTSQAIQEDLGLHLTAASLEQSVSDVLGKVTSGQAHAGWVYSTDAAAASDSVTSIPIPRAEQRANTLYAAVTTHSTATREQRAAELVTYLSSNSARSLWSSHGFHPAD
ncbi:molybdate ABC transporter substrate-binding protein [Corynebacterium sp. zg254]|uniref:Molybdate ABC transporter substrate-binding protein n=2 Tax=Corynebacteriaceae TaxID=1653 RepID=A0ABQ6VGU7_9CORY|nr:molybdate ABC transporter substrate-binding protein [Corynebacterium zhongnanshanii]MCR5913775.1 molybdate ABC transporter substrate-binding protein [Corynebacterium sp. zg254]